MHWRADHRKALLKLNGTSFGAGAKFSIPDKIVSSDFILAKRPSYTSEWLSYFADYHTAIAAALSANQLLRNPELFPNYPASVIVHREH